MSCGFKKLSLRVLARYRPSVYRSPKNVRPVGLMVKKPEQAVYLLGHECFNSGRCYAGLRKARQFQRWLAVPQPSDYSLTAADVEGLCQSGCFDPNFRWCFHRLKHHGRCANHCFAGRAYPIAICVNADQSWQRRRCPANPRAPAFERRAAPPHPWPTGGRFLHSRAADAAPATRNRALWWQMMEYARRKSL